MPRKSTGKAPHIDRNSIPNAPETHREGTTHRPELDHECPGNPPGRHHTSTGTQSRMPRKSTGKAPHIDRNSITNAPEIHREGTTHRPEPPQKCTRNAREIDRKKSRTDKDRMLDMCLSAQSGLSPARSLRTLCRQLRASPRDPFVAVTPCKITHEPAVQKAPPIRCEAQWPLRLATSRRPSGRHHRCPGGGLARAHGP